MMTQVIETFDNFTFTRECILEIYKNFLTNFRIHLNLRRPQTCFECPTARKPLTFQLQCNGRDLPTLLVKTDDVPLLDFGFGKHNLIAANPRKQDILLPLDLVVMERGLLNLMCSIVTNYVGLFTRRFV